MTDEKNFRGFGVEFSVTLSDVILSCPNCKRSKRLPGVLKFKAETCGDIPFREVLARENITIEKINKFAYCKKCGTELIFSIPEDQPWRSGDAGGDNGKSHGKPGQPE